MSNTGTDDSAMDQEGTSVSSGPNNPTESQPDAIDANPEGPGEQAGGGQHGG